MARYVGDNGWDTKVNAVSVGVDRAVVVYRGSGWLLDCG